MENKMIPTAEEFLLQQDCLRNVEDYFDDVQPIDLIEFAKLHVQAIKHLQQCKYYAGETGYIVEEEWENIINNIK